MEKKTALIVGASKGLGLAIVLELLERGWHVTGTVREDGKTKLHTLADSAPCRPPIPIVVGHLFRFKSATYSD